MADMVYYILLAMVGTYFMWLVVSNLVSKILKFKICAICATVVSAWIGLLVLKLMGVVVNQIIIAVLMGQSVVGFMHFLERMAQTTNNSKLLLMKPVVIIVGTLVAYWIISGVYG